MAALNLTSEFDEMAVLKTNLKYVTNTLEVGGERAANMHRHTFPNLTYAS